ncbi:MAG: hypothetical protein IMZ53_15305 [Thermoplasmata archaeon]|nr:hypothetical protein [Thermoplasmata archaeon]
MHDVVLLKKEFDVIAYPVEFVNVIKIVITKSRELLEIAIDLVQPFEGMDDLQIVVKVIIQISDFWVRSRAGRFIPLSTEQVHNTLAQVFVGIPFHGLHEFVHNKLGELSQFVNLIPRLQHFFVSFLITEIPTPPRASISMRRDLPP